MTLSVLRRILMIQIRMLSVIVVSIMMLKRVRFNLERDTTIQVRVDSFHEILLLVILTTRLV